MGNNKGKVELQGKVNVIKLSDKEVIIHKKVKEAPTPKSK